MAKQRIIFTKMIIAGVLVALSTVCVMAEEGDTPPLSSRWETPKQFESLAPHPRLFVSAEQIERMVKGRGEDFADSYETVAAAAETALHDTENPMEGISVWRRGVLIQGRLTALAIQWHRTKDRRYLEAALETVDAMKEWMLPATIRLAEGQFIAGVAVTYDLLYNDLTPEQRAWMVALAREHFAKPFLRATAPSDSEQRVEGEGRSWWMNSISNWNPVSITGGGLLALAMYEDLPEAQTMIDRVNASYQPIYDYLEKTEGGWVEGLGYWNWTMHYMSLFGISYERATGEEQAGFRSPGFKETLTFGTYFVPHGEPCGFADNRHGRSSQSLRAAAVHLGYSDTLLRLQDHVLRMKESSRLKEAKREAAAGETAEDEQETVATETDDKEPVNIGYGVTHDLLIAPDPIEEGLAPQANMTKHYPKQGWGMLADQWPKPTIYAAVRGGELGGAHTHTDLLAWAGLVGIEKMIDDCGNGRNSSAAFGQRGGEIFERSSAAKNTLFIGGLPPSRVRRGQPSAATQALQIPTGPALRLDASKGFWLGRGNPKFVARLFAVIEDKGLLVLDRVIGRAGNPVEVRTYTRKEASFGENDVLLQGEFETARMTFAADAPAVLRRAAALIIDGTGEPPVMMRWQTQGKVRNVTMASLLTRGEGKIDLSVEADEEWVVVTISGDGWTRKIRLTAKLMPKQTEE
ncbi:MAG: heparinase II/III family protein [Lentisphaeria bacterium]